MLEMMGGTNKVMAKVSALIAVILSWIALIMICMTSFISASRTDVATGVERSYLEIYHAMLWPMVIGFLCAGIALVIKGRRTKVNLSWILMIASLWIMMNSILGVIQSPPLTGLDEAVAPLMAPLSTIGGILGTMGGVVGILGAGKFVKD